MMLLSCIPAINITGMRFKQVVEVKSITDVHLNGTASVSDENGTLSLFNRYDCFSTFLPCPFLSL